MFMKVCTSCTFKNAMIQPVEKFPFIAGKVDWFGDYKCVIICAMINICK